jgi:endoglucanase
VGGAVGGSGAKGGSGGANNGGATGGGAVASGGASTVDATALAKAMGFGTNIGNTFENTTSWETGWGQPVVTQAFINGIASRGIKTVRVPVTTGQKVVRQSAARVLWMQSVAKAAMSRGIAPVLWDTGTDIKRSDGSFSSELQTVMNSLK